ncbi:MAG: hypothetical protein HZY75_08045 [Nocardioidaceae bacterium]|nr:MAG: hypothetical protein HZY75_08045 [Nocardioidaceae bacterium]
MRRTDCRTRAGRRASPLGRDFHRQRVAHLDTPRSFAPAATTIQNASPLFENLPGRVRMIVFWGEPGAHEPLNTTPLMFLGVDGRWRSLTASDLGVQLSTDYLQNRGVPSLRMGRGG